MRLCQIASCDASQAEIVHLGLPFLPNHGDWNEMSHSLSLYNGGRHNAATRRAWDQSSAILRPPASIVADTIRTRRVRPLQSGI